MKELIKKILREEVQKRFIKSSPNLERIIIKHMESLLSESTRIIPPPDDNYGNYGEEWCKNGRAVVEARYYFNSDEDGEDEEKFYSGYLIVNQEEIDFLSKMLQVRKSFIFTVITEWYDEKYATKFGQETGHPELEIDETGETDMPVKCYENVNTDDLNRDEMIDYIDKYTAYGLQEIEEMDDEELMNTYKRVYNIQLNK